MDYYENQQMYHFALMNDTDQEQIAALAALEAVQSPIFFTPPITPPLQEQPEEIEDDDEPVPENGRIYKCPRPNCTKAYKNRNGLKYHLQKGVCSDQVRDDPMTPTSSSPSSPKRSSDEKPFYCKLCSKRYKNLNGLKYHARADHKGASFQDLKGKDEY